MKEAAINLAIARANLQATSTAAAAAHAELSVLEGRIVDAQEKHDTALADMRAGHLDEAIAGARMAVSTADIADLRVMILELQPKVDEADRARDQADRTAQLAEQAVFHEERTATRDALDQHIVHVELKLCEALAERFRLGRGARESCVSLHNIWQPSEALRRAVIEKLPPGG